LNKEWNLPIRNLLEFGIEPFWPVPDSESVSTLISSYFKWRIHRCPVISQKKIVGHVSQSDVVAFLAKNLKQLESLTNQTIQDLSLSTGPVLSVRKGEPLIKAFERIVETRFTGLAVIDDQGRLLNNISASDLKGITRESFFKVEMPIEKAIDTKLPPLTCRPQDTLGDVITRLADCRVHRTYVVDGDFHPTNVITLTTIMKLFSAPGTECFV